MPRSAAITFSSQAYVKVYFHAAKHPHQTINGVLVGKQSSDGTIEVQDAIPLLHHWTNLSPMMEIGLDLAEQYATDAGSKLVGYYQAKASIGDISLGPVGEAIAQRLQSKFADAFAVTLDGEDFGSSSPALIVWTSEATQWKRVTQPEPFSQSSSIQLDKADLPEKAASYVKDKDLHMDFGDFDDHLENVSIDWIHNQSCMQAVQYLG
ncbi:hypothetical protein BKA70DRAFT_1265342 [Coprinopsis sp. MPI-PUGE-AT-0042]|nr:hypothetical protein BKA70DRAFT_1265342 [Coprinopsis sp. MPI-PUGE-AT-0042]